MNFALLLIRVVVGLLLAGHGAQKLFGWFGGYGLAGTGGFFESIGYKPGKLMAFLAGLGEAGGVPRAGARRGPLRPAQVAAGRRERAGPLAFAPVPRRSSAIPPRAPSIAVASVGRKIFVACPSATYCSVSRYLSAMRSFVGL